MLLQITQADIDAADATRLEKIQQYGSNFGTITHCPIAQAVKRMYPEAVLWKADAGCIMAETSSVRLFWARTTDAALHFMVRWDRCRPVKPCRLRLKAEE